MKYGVSHRSHQSWHLYIKPFSSCILISTKSPLLPSQQGKGSLSLFSLFCEVPTSHRERKIPLSDYLKSIPNYELITYLVISFMELRSNIRKKRLSNYLRAIYFMMRKGLISKRKLLMDLNVAMKRRNKVLSRSFTNIFLHGSKRDLGFGLHEYEFSCSNSPNPAVFSHKRRHNYFPCLGSVSEEPEMWWSHGVALRRIEYSPSPSPKISLFTSGELAPGEKRSLTPSPISIRIIDYSDEEEEQDVPQEENIVDGEAEEFIRRFYEQLQAQNRIALLEYQEREYQQMLA